jgi:hypothetical protein
MSDKPRFDQPEEIQQYPAGRGKKAVFGIFRTGQRKPRKSKYCKEDYVNGVSLGKNPIHSFTYNLETDCTSFDYYNKNIRRKDYEVLHPHDEEDAHAFLHALSLWRKEKKRQDRLNSSDKRDRDRERDRVACHCHATLSSHLENLRRICDNYERLSVELSKKVVGVVKKFEAAERKRALRRRKLITYGK